MNDPQHEAFIEELRKVRREISAVKIAVWTGVALFACGLVAVMIEAAWFRSNFGTVLLTGLFAGVLLPWLGKWFYRGAKEAMAQKNPLQPYSHE